MTLLAQSFGYWNKRHEKTKVTFTRQVNLKHSFSLGYAYGYSLLREERVRIERQWAKS